MQRAFRGDEARAMIWAQYEEVLTHLTVPHERRAVDTRCGKTHLIAAGPENAPPVVLLHGSSMNAGMWVSDIPALCARYRVYAPDLPGEAGKSDDRQLPFEGEDFTEWLLDAYAALGIDRAALVGASLGGFVAAKFAIAHARRVSALMLMCPAGIGGQNAAFRDIASELLPRGEAGVEELFRMIGGGALPEAVLRYQKIIAMGFNARQEPIPRFSDELLLRLTMPGMVVVGGMDILLRSEETVRRVERLLPHWRTLTLPERGHSLTGLSAEIAAFLLEAGW